MSEYSPVQSALDAEKVARQAVEAARAEAIEIRRDALARAHAIDRKAQERLQKLQVAIDEQIEAQRQVIEHNGANAMRRLRGEALDPGIMTSAIAQLVNLILAEAEDGD